jgi:acyl-CoA synthetase (AMP-forming)/AMP-acid ligase II
MAVTLISRAGNPFPRDRISVDSKGVPRYSNLPASLTVMLERQVQAAGSAEAVVEIGGRRLTYAELWAAASRVAGGLRTAGVAVGDRVAIRYPAGVDWVVAFFGTIMAGGIAVAVNTRSSQPEIEFVLADAGVKVDLARSAPLPDGEPIEPVVSGHSDVAAMFYTSGTTGKPKGVPTTHEAFLTNIENMLCGLGISADIGAELRTLISVPLFHVTGCNSQVLVALAVGGTAVILPAFDQAAAVGAITAERITFMVTVPAIYALLLRRDDFKALDLSRVRWVGYGGAPIAPALVRALQAAFSSGRVFNGYGMTETASLMTSLPHDDALEHADSVGYAVPSVDLAVRPIGEDPMVGELVARGANAMTGYWGRPDKTVETIVDGWLHTGDIVRVDEAGRVHIIDRIKDIIIRGGENISSIEVEAALVSAPGVLEAAVLAVPDDVMGEKVGAVLYGGEGAVDVEAVLAACRVQLADFKVPQYICVFHSPLPRNPSGKLLKDVLRKSVEWGPALR